MLLTLSPRKLLVLSCPPTNPTFTAPFALLHPLRYEDTSFKDVCLPTLSPPVRLTAIHDRRFPRRYLYISRKTFSLNAPRHRDTIDGDCYKLLGRARTFAAFHTLAFGTISLGRNKNSVLISQFITPRPVCFIVNCRAVGATYSQFLIKIRTRLMRFVGYSSLVSAQIREFH